MKMILWSLLLIIGPFVAAQCVEHEGLSHCALDGTTLQERDGTLYVDGSGVQISFSPVISWNAALKWDNDQQMRIDATDKGVIFSSLIITETKNLITMSTSFTGQPGGTPATLMIYQGGNLQHFVQDVYVAITDPNDANRSTRTARPRPHFRNQTVTGACIWTLSYDEMVTITVNGQLYYGDQIEFVEQMGSGHYPYASFDGMRISGTSPFQIGIESVGCSP